MVELVLVEIVLVICMNIQCQKNNLQPKLSIEKKSINMFFHYTNIWKMNH
jgi:hypothetical protein